MSVSDWSAGSTSNSINIRVDANGNYVDSTGNVLGNTSNVHINDSQRDFRVHTSQEGMRHYQEEFQREMERLAVIESNAGPILQGDGIFSYMNSNRVSEIKNKYEGNMNNTKIRVTISQLLSDLNNGITRCKGDTGYDEKRGSVEEKYGLTKEAVKEIFRHPKLANLRVRIPTIEEKNYELVDDVEDKEPKAVENANKPKFGEKSASQTERLKEKEEIKTVSVTEMEKETAKSEETSF